MAAFLENKAADTREGKPWVAARAGEQSPYATAFTAANLAISGEMGEACNFGGTTAVTGYLRGTALGVANVGDSRMIVCRKVSDNSKRWQGHALTRDQTCFREDERRRIRREAMLPVEFLTMGMYYGEVAKTDDFGEESIEAAEDPPRVFMAGQPLPGSAFTRSLGDTVAKSLGVTAVPEVSEVQLYPADEAIVVASDGVFEFMEDDEVAELVRAHCKRGPAAAAGALVDEAFDRWLAAGEDRTDDISAVVVYLENVPASKAVHSEGGQRAWDAAARALGTARANRTANKFAGVVLDVARRELRKRRKSLHITDLFPDFDFSPASVKNIIGGTKISG